MLVPDGLVPNVLVPDWLVPDGLVPDGLVPARLVPVTLDPGSSVEGSWSLVSSPGRPKAEGRLYRPSNNIDSIRKKRLKNWYSTGGV